MVKKIDRSKECGLGYEQAWITDTIEELYDKYCYNCIYMNEICMCGIELVEKEVNNDVEQG